MWRPPKPFLGVSKKVGYVDLPVSRVELDDPVYSGVKLTSLVEGMVPIYEEQAARAGAGISIEAWAAVPYFVTITVLR